MDQKLTPQKIHILNFQALKCPESIKGYIVKPRQFALSPGKESPAYNPDFESVKRYSSNVDIINSKRQVKGKFRHVVQIVHFPVRYIYMTAELKK